jgi:hypothetical protein
VHKNQVHRQVAVALAILVVLYLTIWLGAAPMPAADVPHRLLLAAKLMGFAVLPLFAGISAAVYARYSAAALIQGFKSVPSERLALLLAYNQNTLEQTVLHALSLPIFCVTVPAALLVFAYAQVAAFLLGRLMFYIGYRRAPLQRLAGFAVGHYPAIAAVLVGCAMAVFSA